MPQLSELSNPFHDNVVHDAWQSPNDIPEINAHVFEACCLGLEAARRGESDSLIIYGSAGSGKTHLLSRFQRHLQAIAAQSEDRALASVFVFVRLQTSPQMLWQHLRRRLAADLMRSVEGATQLQRLVAHQIAERTGSKPRAQVMELRVLGREQNDVVTSHLRRLALDFELPPDLCTVLGHLLCGRSTVDAAAWLRGDSLSERVLSELGLGLDELEDREQAARDIVLALARLAASSLPIIFCFDQIEALQRSHDDLEALFRFGRMGADLADSDPNVLLITCLQSALLQPFRAAVRQADQDRFMKRSVSIYDLSPEQVLILLEQRLRLVPELLDLKPADDSAGTFPFTPEFVRQLLADKPLVPRRVLAKAKLEFEHLQRGRTKTRKSLPDFLSEQWKSRELRAVAKLEPSRTSATLLKAAPIFGYLGELQARDGHSVGTELLLEPTAQPQAGTATPGSIALSLRNEEDGRSLVPKLKQLRQKVEAHPELRWAILRDPRLPISDKAVKAKEHLAALSRAGVRFVEPSAAALLLLETLSALLADAKSGDLALDGETIVDSAVCEWLRGLKGQLSIEPIAELLEELTCSGPPDSRQLEHRLSALLQERRCLSLREAGELLGAADTELLKTVAQASSRFLLLNGPPPVLLDISGVEAWSGELT